MIDEHCDPASVIQDAAIEAVDLYKSHYGYSPPVEIMDKYKGRLAFIPMYLHYIIFELLKNSLRATVESTDREDHVTPSEKRLQSRPVRILVSGNESLVVVRVSDEGAGIMLDDLWAG